MSARKQRSELEHEVTAQPRPVSEALRPPAHESGLSVDPEDLGTHFLNEATEQTNFESSDASDLIARSIVEGAPSDEPLIGPNFESDREIWEQTVDLALQSGGIDQTRPPAALVEPEPEVEAVRELSMVDVRGPGVREGSLFDEERDELGETAQPKVEADDDEARSSATPTLIGSERERERERGMHPLLAGLLATAAMSVAMRIAQAAGLLRRPPPATITQRALRLPPASVAPTTPLINTLAHLGYGAALALPFAALQPRIAAAGARVPIVGMAYGLVVYAANYELALPALGLMPPAHDDDPERIAAMTAAHLIYGGTLELLLRGRGFAAR